MAQTTLVALRVDSNDMGGSAVLVHETTEGGQVDHSGPWSVLAEGFGVELSNGQSVRVEMETEGGHSLAGPGLVLAHTIWSQMGTPVHSCRIEGRGPLN